MRKRFAIGVACGFLAFAMAADDSVATAVVPALNEWSGDVAKIQSAEADAPGAWEAAGRGQFFSKATLPVNPVKGYRLAGSFRVPEGVAPQSLYFGIVMYDETGEIIKPQWVFAVKDTLTRLTAPVKAGDRSIRIADASGWKTGAVYVAAFQADPDGQNADLPNRRVSS